MKKRFLGLGWKEHLIYAVLLLATGWLFQHKTTEQARLHGIMEEVFPLAAQAISTRQNERLMQHINREADYYRSDRRESYRARAKDIQKWVEISSLELKRIAETPDVEFQRKELVPLLEQLSHLPDSILQACDSDSAIGQRLRQIYPEEFWDMTAQYLPRAEQPELVRLANALRVRVGLAANAGLRYCFSRVRDYAIRYAHIPVLNTRHPCPRVGEMFEAEINFVGYIADPDFEVEINGRPVVSDNGLVHFETRFTRPGKK
ncbi:MAG: hypothetical protein JNJ90_13825 [Saprospiraceae bacterium]|jgi:hypothetical protein|nr:hypothetical protein [Saprospiraceae bacterium]